MNASVRGKLHNVSLAVLGAGLLTCMLAPQAQAGNIPFESELGAYGDLLENGISPKIGAFAFNIFNPGDTVAIGVWLLGQWNQTPPIVGFHIDFSNSFSSSVYPVAPKIASAEFLNENDLSNHGDDVPWLGSHGDFTATFTNTGPGDSILNGEWWEARIRFDTNVGGVSSPFSGYFVVDDAGGRDNGQNTVPELATFMLLTLGLGSLYMCRSRRTIAYAGAKK